MILDEQQQVGSFGLPSDLAMHALTAPSDHGACTHSEERLDRLSGPSVHAHMEIYESS